MLSMARSMLSGAVSKAASAAADEMSLLMGVRKDIWFIKDELETMQAFLVAAERMKQKDMLLKVWAKQVRDLSYNIEDCLGEFMVHVRSQSLSQQLMKLKDRHRIAMQIRDLKSRVEEVSSRNTRYNLIDKSEGTGMVEERDSFLEDIRNQSASNIDEAELVGFTKPKQDLIELIDVHAINDPAKVVCVVGMGGLGKTTITRKVYESVKKDFSCCAWIILSQSFVRMEVLKVMIKELFGDGALKQQLERKLVREEDLARYLRKELKEKRYFVVLDDLWNLDHWEWVRKIAFPSNNVKGSRIIVTTRDAGLANDCTFEPRDAGLAKDCTFKPLIFHLKALAIDDATKLLLRKTRKRLEDMKNDETMRKIVPKIVKKCGCLPLAILTIGGLLATKMVTGWESIYNQIPLELERPNLATMRRMVTLSYNHLPSHLKLCFLYLSIFPEDFEIQRSRLVGRWIAEGFVEARAGMNIVDIGNGYFDELINRSMIQPSRLNIEGTVKSCRVHDIVRDVMVSISIEENFVGLIGGDIITSVPEENFRHIAYHGTKCRTKAMDCSHVRSLTMFGERPMEPSPSVCSSEFRMLRILDLNSAQFTTTQNDIQNIGLLGHLKYLNVYTSRWYSYIYKLPRSIGKLQGLQILDIRDTYITTLPREISKLKSLRALRCCNQSYDFCDPVEPKECLLVFLLLPLFFTPLLDENRAKVIAKLHKGFSSRWSMSRGVKVPRGIGNLKELQVLETVDIKRTSSKAIEELGQLTLLRKLKVNTEGATVKKCKILCVSSENLSSLRSLHVNAGRDGTLEWLHSVSAPPLLLRSLWLYGRLGEEMPNWVGSLMQLVKITLLRSRLKEGGKIMEILGALPNLVLLSLHLNAYLEEKLVFRTGAFPKLKQLEIYGPGELKGVRFEEGTSPHMEMIVIGWHRLESGIFGIKHLPRLKEISLGWGGYVARLGVLQGEVDAHPNKPVLQLKYDRSEHDLGDIVQGSDAVQVEEAMEEESSLHPEPAAAAGESSSQAVIHMPMTNTRQDDLLHTYNSC